MKEVDFAKFLANIKNPEVKTEFLSFHEGFEGIVVKYYLTKPSEFNIIKSSAEFCYGEDLDIKDQIAVAVTSDDGSGYFATVEKCN